jgi:amino acid permease
LFIQFVAFGTTKFDVEQDKNGKLNNHVELNFESIKFAPADSNINNKISAVGNMMVAFFFALNLFPIFSSLKVKTNRNMTITTIFGISLTFAIYCFLSFICLFMFG